MAPQIGSTVKRRGQIYSATFFYPSISQTDRSAITNGIKNWINARFEWYEKNYMEPLVGGWDQDHQPVFRKQFTASGGTVEGKWFTESKPFLWLDGGAEEVSVKRRVLIDPNTAPKTKARHFSSSGPGAKALRDRYYRKVFFSSKNKKKFKRIRPRKWMKEIARREFKLLGGAEKGEGKVGVILSMFEQSIFVDKLNKRWTLRKLQGADYLTPADPYSLRTVKKATERITV